MNLPYTKAEIIPHKLHCTRCGDTGKLMALKKDESALPYAFRCSFCSRGDHVKVSFVQWSMHLEKTFKVLS